MYVQRYYAKEIGAISNICQRISMPNYDEKVYVKEQGTHSILWSLSLQNEFKVVFIIMTSDLPRLRTGAMLILKCFSNIAYKPSSIILKEFLKSEQ
jgi:hypothetical protein